MSCLHKKQQQQQPSSRLQFLLHAKLWCTKQKLWFFWGRQSWLWFGFGLKKRIKQHRARRASSKGKQGKLLCVKEGKGLLRALHGAGKGNIWVFPFLPQPPWATQHRTVTLSFALFKGRLKEKVGVGNCFISVLAKSSLTHSAPFLNPYQWHNTTRQWLKLCQALILQASRKIYQEGLCHK